MPPRFPSRALTFRSPAVRVPTWRYVARREMGMWASLKERLQQEINKDKELKQGLEDLKQKRQSLRDSRGVQAMKQTASTLYDTSASVTEAGKKQMSKLGQAASTTRDVIGQSLPVRIVSSTTSLVSRGMKKVFGPIVGHRVFDPLRSSISSARKEMIEDPALRYGGISSRERREHVKSERIQAAGLSEEEAARLRRGEEVETQPEAGTEENPNAGENVVLHKDSRWREAWNSFKEGNPVIQGIFSFKRSVEESDNFLANTYRSVAGKFTSLMEENETGATIRQLQAIDPSFQLEAFVKEAREYIIPEVMEAFLARNEPILKQWCSEAAFNVLKAGIAASRKANAVVDARILELRHVEVAAAKMMDDTPLLVLTFQTHQTECVRNKQGELIEGDPNKIQAVHYAWAITKELERMNPITQGWVIKEMGIAGMRETI